MDEKDLHLEVFTAFKDKVSEFLEIPDDEIGRPCFQCGLEGGFS